MRYCFNLQVRPDRMAEYVERHQAVWPEMQDALRATGWRNYSLFLRTDGLLIGYVEADDLAASQAAMASGQITGKEGDKFKAGKLGDYTIGKDGEIVLGPPTEFTPANIDQFHF